jgi:hypothetical protein
VDLLLPPPKKASALQPLRLLLLLRARTTLGLQTLVGFIIHLDLNR